MREKNNVRQLIFAGAALMLVIVLFIMMIVSYFQRFDRTLLEENRTRLSEVADHIAAYMNVTVRETQTALQIIADGLSMMPEEMLQREYLQDAAKKQDFTYLGYAGADGMLWAAELPALEDISDTSYFQAALRGESTITRLTRRIFEDKAVSGVILAVPAGTPEGGAVVAMLDIMQFQRALFIRSLKNLSRSTPFRVLSAPAKPKFKVNPRWAFMGFFWHGGKRVAIPPLLRINFQGHSHLSIPQYNRHNISFFSITRQQAEGKPRIILDLGRFAPIVLPANLSLFGGIYKRLSIHSSPIQAYQATAFSLFRIQTTHSGTVK